MTEANIEQLITDLQADDLSVRYRSAFELLKQNRSEGLEVIVEYIDQRHFRYFDSYTAIDQLTNVKDERVVDALINMLDMSAHVVGNVLASLLAIGTEKSIQAVFDKLKTPSPWFGWGTAQLIADHGERYIPRLLESIQNPNPLMRARAVYALSLIAMKQENTESIENILITALNDDDTLVREKAVWGLSRIYSPEVQSVLIKVLDSDDIAATQWAAEGLYRVGVEQDRVVTLLIRTLEHRNWLIRRNAIWALKRLGDTKAVPALIYALENDENRGLRMYSAEALAELNDDRAVQPLRSALKDKDHLVRAACVKALAKIVGKDILPEFQELLFDTELLVQQAVIEVWDEHEFRPNTN